MRTDAEAAARKVQDLADYRASAKKARARVRREYAKLVALWGYNFPAGWVHLPEAADYISAVKTAEVAKAEVRNVRNTSLDYYR